MGTCTQRSDAAFSAYVDPLVKVIGHADRIDPLRDCCFGLLMPLARKSVEPMAAVTAPARVAAKYQTFLHFVGQAPWSDEAVMAQVPDHVLPVIESTTSLWITTRQRRFTFVRLSDPYLPEVNLGALTPVLTTGQSGELTML